MDFDRKNINITLTHYAARRLRNLVENEMQEAVLDMVNAPTSERRSAAITYGNIWAELYDIINNAICDAERG